MRVYLYDLAKRANSASGLKFVSCLFEEISARLSRSFIDSSAILFLTKSLSNLNDNLSLQVEDKYLLDK